MYITWLLPAASGQGGRQGGLGAREGWGAGAALGLTPTLLPHRDEHPEVTQPWLGRVPRDKAVTAAMCPRAGSPRGLEGAWGGAGTPQDCCGFCLQAVLAFPKPAKQEEEPLDPRDSAVCSREPGAAGGESGHSRGHAVPQPLVPASPELSDVNMAFVSQGAAAVLCPAPLPTSTEIPARPSARDEERARLPQPPPQPSSRSRLSLQDCSYHQQSPAPAGNEWHRPLSPGPREAGWGARASLLQLPKRLVSHAGTRRGGQERGEELQPCPVPDGARVSVPAWGQVTAPSGATAAAEPGRRRREERERSRDAETCRQY